MYSAKKTNNNNKNKTVMTIIWNYLWRQLNNIVFLYWIAVSNALVFVSVVCMHANNERGGEHGVFHSVPCIRIVHVRLCIIHFDSHIYGALIAPKPCHHIELFHTVHCCISVSVCLSLSLVCDYAHQAQRLKLNEHFLTQFSTVLK